MLFHNDTLEEIRTGGITLAFRRWRRPSVRAGGRLLTAIGEISIESVERVAIEQISAADARRAGYESKHALLHDLQRRTEGEIYRIQLAELRPDPWIALREASLVSKAESAELQARLTRFDQSAPDGALTLRTLVAIEVHPGVRAADLCGLVGQEKERFKVNVRKLKNLGLTESLGTGYRLSPRDEAFIRCLRSEGEGSATEPGQAGAALDRCRRPFRSSQNSEHRWLVVAASLLSRHCTRGYADSVVGEPACHQQSSEMANVVCLLLPRQEPLRPTTELAHNIGLSSANVKDEERLVESRQQEIIDAWNNHFGG